MALRVHEVHPSVVHFPLALFPASVACDALGLLRQDDALLSAGRFLMSAAAMSAAVAGLAGFAAQEGVYANDDAHDLLVTHRNVNVGLVILTALLAFQRRRRKRPSAGYMCVALGGFAAMTYTAYLGGKMVYSKGVGVEPAGGVRFENAPEVRVDDVAEAVQTSASNFKHAGRHAADHLREGEIAPVFGAQFVRRSAHEQRSA